MGLSSNCEPRADKVTSTSSMVVPHVDNSRNEVNHERLESGEPGKKRKKYYVCAVATCLNPQDRDYHRFPGKKDNQRRLRWLQAVKRADKVNLDDARVCHNHFSPAMVKRDLEHELLGLPLRSLLNPDAVPDQNLPSDVQFVPFLPEFPERVIESNLPAGSATEGSSNKNSSKACAVVGCKNPDGITYHNFPQIGDLSKTWSVLCGRGEEFKTKGKKICSNHFPEDAFRGDIRTKRLKKDVVPTLNLPLVEEQTVQVVGGNDTAIVSADDDADLEFLEMDTFSEPPEMTARDKRRASKAQKSFVTDAILADADESKKVLERKVSVLQEEIVQLKEEHQTEVQALKARIAELENESKRRKANNTRLKQSNKRLEKANAEHEKLKDSLSKRMSPGNLKMYMNPEQKWVKYSDKDKVEALVLHSISQKGYKQLREFNQLTLPSETTIRNWLANFDCKPGYQEDSIRIVKMMLEKTELKWYDLAALAFDEMDVKKNLREIDMKAQRVYGPNNKVQTVAMRGLVQH